MKWEIEVSDRAVDLNRGEIQMNRRIACNLMSAQMALQLMDINQSTIRLKVFFSFLFVEAVLAVVPSFRWKTDKKLIKALLKKFFANFLALALLWCLNELFIDFTD